MHDKKFMFFENYLKVIKKLPSQEQDKVLRAIVEYGLYGTKPSEPVAAAIIQSLSVSLDKSREYHDQKQTQGKKGGRSQKVSDDRLREILIEMGRGSTSKEIAAAAGMSSSALNKRKVWKERDEIWREEEDKQNGKFVF